MNPSFIAFTAGLSVMLLWFGLTRSAFARFGDELEPDDEWAPGVDAPVLVRFIGPLARRWRRETSLGARLTSPDAATLAHLTRTLIQAGNPWGLVARDLYSIQVAGLVFGSLGGMYLFALLEVGWWAGLVVGFLLFLAPRAMVNRLAAKRLDATQRSLPSMLDLLVVNAESGRTLRAGFALVATKMTGPLAEEMAHVNRLLELGTPDEEAFQVLADRTGLPDLEQLASSLITSVRYGGVDLRHALKMMALHVRTARRQEIETEINKLTVKLVFPIFVFMFPSFLALFLGPALIDFGNRF